MFIKCESDNNEDRFYIPTVKNMKDLKEYADKNMPVECFKLTYRRHGRTYLKDESIPVHLYLNNYFFYSQVFLNLMDTEEEYNNLTNKQCKNCKYYKSNCRICNEILKEGCKSFEKEASLKDLFVKFRR